MARAISKYVRVSPYKLRPFADVVRGDRVDNALAWLKTYSINRVTPLMKTIFSAYSNAKNLDEGKGTSMHDFVIRIVQVDEGPVVRYFKPGAMGRASVQKKRMSHIQVVVEKQS